MWCHSNTDTAEKAVAWCTLVNLTIYRRLVFFLKRNMFYNLIEGAIVCTVYKIFFCCIFISLSAVNLMLIIEMIKQRDNKAATKIIPYMLLRNIQDDNHIENVKSTCNWHDFEFQTSHGFCSRCTKTRNVYHFS